jgi:hypothetical protein
MSDRDGIVSIATHYGLDGLRIESQWGRDFPRPSRPAPRPTHPPVQWLPDLSWAYSGRSVVLTSHLLVAPGCEWVVAVPPPTLCACTGLSWSDLYLTNDSGRVVAQAVSRRPLTAEARVRSRISPCGFCGRQSGTGTVFSTST